MNCKELHSIELQVKSCPLLPDSWSVVKQWFFERADWATALGVFGQKSEAQGGIVGVSVQGQELDLDPWGPFQLRVFCDSWACPVQGQELHWW